MEWAEFVAWAIFIFFMSIVFPIILVGSILCLTFRRQSQIRTVPSTPYVIDQTDRQTELPYPGFVIPSYPNNSILRSSPNEHSVSNETIDAPPPYSSIHESQFSRLQTQLSCSEQNAAHFSNPSTGRRVRFSIDKPLIFGIVFVFPSCISGLIYCIIYYFHKANQNVVAASTPVSTTIQPSNPPNEPAYQISVQAAYQNELNNQPQNQPSFQTQVAVPNSIPLQTLTRPTTLAIPQSEQSAQNQFIPIPSPFTSQEPTTFPPIPSSSSNRTINSTSDDPPPSYHKIDKL